MPDYPRTTAARHAERAQIRRGVLATAEHRARALGRSLKCSGYAGGNYVPTAPALHASTEGGCRNDGSTCICECHDPKEPA